MGIPKFFRWLSERYPLINQTIDYANSGPLFDNLYLDMNGIIHNCTHPNDDDIHALAGLSEFQMFSMIFRYIDNLFTIIRPKKTFFMAIDGVAPRAKMNQQRQRRFRSAQEAERKMRDLLAKGEDPPDEKPFDSNCITPGTTFMARLSNHLKFFIRKKIKEDDAWKAVDIIFSGHEVPGEGEHKIMEWIRNNKAQPDWDPNQTHCMYGLDADLVMLSLVTHEPHFALLREEGILDKKKRGRTGDSQEFHLLHISLVREYLDLDFRSSFEGKLNFDYSLENVIDDFVFLCFLIGNDFVPSLPGLDIAEGTLEDLFKLYKDLLPNFDGYLMKNGQPVFSRLEKVFEKLGDIERSKNAILPDGIDRVSKEVLKDNRGKADLAGVLYAGGLSVSSSSLASSNYSETGEDNLWKNLYYKPKLGVEVEDEEFHFELRKSYLEALCWIAHYYYHGVASWGWFYPYHYTPLAVDLTNLSQYSPISFTLGTPFLPLQQLLGVLPPASRSFLPAPYRHIMIDENSAMRKYYPLDFEIDMNGKKNDWEAIILIPFIDEKLLRECTENVSEKELTKDERKLNRFGQALLYRYDIGVKTNVSSTLPSLFDDVLECRSSCAPYKLPSLPNGVTDPLVLSPKTMIGYGAPPGIPTFKSISLKPTLATMGTNVFGHPSRRESLLLVLDVTGDSFPPDQEQQLANRLLGYTCFVWPYHRESLIVSVSTKNSEYSLDHPPVSRTYEQKSLWRKEGSYLQSAWKTKCAVAIDVVDVILGVQNIVGVARSPDGSVNKRWGEKIVKIPLTLSLNRPPTIPDPRFIEHSPATLREQFPLYSSVFSISKHLFGALATVVGYSTKSNQNQRVKVEVREWPREPDFLREFVKKNSSVRYHSLNFLAREMGVSSRTLSKITAAVKFEPGSFNFGLNIKFSGRNQQVLSYTRRRPGPDGRWGPWEFSEKAVAILKEYYATYPAIFEQLEKYPDRNLYDSREIFPTPQLVSVVVDRHGRPLRIVEQNDSTGETDDTSPEGASANNESGATKGRSSHHYAQLGNNESIVLMDKRLLEVRDYLNALPCTSLHRVKCGSVSFSKELVERLEKSIDDWIEQGQQQQGDFVPGKKPQKYLPPEYLVRPARDYEERVPRESYHLQHDLGDRVVYIRCSGPTSFGYRGTVVAVKEDFTEVLFDHRCVGGTSLNGLCSDLRGAVLSRGALINLSKLTGGALAPRASTKPSTRSYTAHPSDPRRPNTMGRGGRGGKGRGGLVDRREKLVSSSIRGEDAYHRSNNIGRGGSAIPGSVRSSGGHVSIRTRENEKEPQRQPHNAWNSPLIKHTTLHSTTLTSATNTSASLSSSSNGTASTVSNVSSIEKSINLSGTAPSTQHRNGVIGGDKNHIAENEKGISRISNVALKSSYPYLSSDAASRGAGPGNVGTGGAGEGISKGSPGSLESDSHSPGVVGPYGSSTNSISQPLSSSQQASHNLSNLSFPAFLQQFQQSNPGIIHSQQNLPHQSRIPHSQLLKHSQLSHQQNITQPPLGNSGDSSPPTSAGAPFTSSALPSHQSFLSHQPQFPDLRSLGPDHQRFIQQQQQVIQLQHQYLQQFMNSQQQNRSFPTAPGGYPFAGMQNFPQSAQASFGGGVANGVGGSGMGVGIGGGGLPREMNDDSDFSVASITGLPANPRSHPGAPVPLGHPSTPATGDSFNLITREQEAKMIGELGLDDDDDPNPSFRYPHEPNFGNAFGDGLPSSAYYRPVERKREERSNIHYNF